jgi:hypothetical protein
VPVSYFLLLFYAQTHIDVVFTARHRHAPLVIVVRRASDSFGCRNIRLLSVCEEATFARPDLCLAIEPGSF